MHNLPGKSKTNFFFFFVVYSLCELLETPVHIILIESCVLWRKGPGGTHARRKKNKQTQRVRLGTKYVIVTHITPSPGRNKIKEITGRRLRSAGLSPLSLSLQRRCGRMDSEEPISHRQNCQNTSTIPHTFPHGHQPMKKTFPHNPWRKNGLPPLRDGLLTGPRGHETPGKLSKSDLSFYRKVR